MGSFRPPLRPAPVLALVGALSFLACSSGPELEGDVRPLVCTPPAELGPVAVGSSVTVEVGCEVTARAGVELTAVGATAPFTAQGPEGIWRPGGSLPISVTFAPTAAGTFEGQVAIAYRVDGVDQAEETFAVRGRALPDLAWDADPVPPGCRADGDAPLLDQALGIAGLDRGTFRMTDLSAWELLNDPFRLSWFVGTRGAPARAGCFEGAAAGLLDSHLASPHPIAGTIRHAAALLDRAVEGPAMPGGAALLSFDDAIERLCIGPAGPCGTASGAVPEDLGRALAPILAAISDGLAARAAMAAADTEGRTPAFWFGSGGNQVLGGLASPDPTKPGDLAYLLGENGRRNLYRAAARLAYAVESFDRAAFAGRTGLRYDLETAAGWIRLRDAAADVYEDDGTATLLLVDTGGDDVHRDPAGSNRDEANPVSLAMDLAGADFYGYAIVTDPDDRPEVLPSDEAGRTTTTAERIGATRSTRSRQGAARNGIAMLFDFGDGDDRYESLEASQGYAHLGVGVLFDAGGDDVYLSESASQGAGIYGIGVLVDAGEGNDVRRSFTNSQGFAYVAGAGFLVDGGGNDVYFCDPGSAGGGVVVYPSAQMTSDGNNSFCQGAGFGMRSDGTGVFLSGGLGILRDARGDDEYTASVFAQGAGYWQGTGILSDGDGADHYEAFWYIQGGAAHFAVGILADGGGGDDVWNRELDTRNVSLGSGHDFSLGALISGGGNDEFHLGTLSAGASNCNGIGVFVDDGGDDRYLAFSDYGSGMGNIGGETNCLENRAELPSIGIMIDGGGADSYEYPTSEFTVPTDGGTWGHARRGLPSEHGGGVDGAGETGIHPESETL